ncbi:MAG: transporter substrate-binding domain-containing protein [Candidatus Cloacimonetes bacterium]|nr:transporter substrate-binding domain-containing protein [Candidatus Cloacimonadota bacterium]
MRIRVLGLLLVLAMCISLSAQEQTSVPRKVIIGGDFCFPPYEFLNEQSIPDGYNVELSKAICRQLGWQPEFRLAKWSLVRQWLDRGEVDLIQGMAFSVDRAKTMNFSEAHAQTWRSVFVRKNSPIREIKDIIHASIVLQKGDISKDFLKRVNFQGNIIEVPTQEDALKLLDSGKYDASIVTHMNAMYIVKQENLKHIKALPFRIMQREYCFASQDPKLIDEVNNALLILSQNGQLAAIQEKWFEHYDLYSELELNRNTTTLLIIHGLFFIFLMVLLLSILLYRNRKYKKTLSAEQTKRESIETELMREYRIFEKGPVILYKMQSDPPRALMVSENIDQWGYSVDEIIAMGEEFSGIVFSEDRLTFLANESMDDSGEFFVKRYRILTKTGEMRWVLDYATLIDSVRNYPLYYGYMMDITGQTNLEAQLLESKEKAESANTAKGHFLATMSHEIRTPLNGIMGFLQVLMQMDASPEQKEYYEIMYSSGRNLMKIINDILDFSKIESGKMELIISDFNPRILIDDILKTFIIQNKKPNLDIRSHINERIPNVLHGDQLRLKQVFVNLLQNAVKFTESGYVDVSADIYTISNDDIRILFCVTDTGIGIDPRKQQDIFDNFSQADSMVTSKYGGTGLGLSIVKRLVELMNGFIWVESEHGTGSSFFFILPFAINTVQPERETTHASHPEIKLQHLPGMEVLIVEDEPINQIVTRRQLEGWGIKVNIAANGQDALDYCSVRTFDAILMDIQMPLMDGITATKILREREKATGKHTPIIAFTAAALVGDRERFLAAGMDAYIAKPIDMNLLYSCLRTYAKTKQV